MKKSQIVILFSIPKYISCVVPDRAPISANGYVKSALLHPIYISSSRSCVNQIQYAPVEALGLFNEPISTRPVLCSGNA